METLSEADIYAMPEPQMATIKRTFVINGKEMEFTIETGGQNSGERWHELYAAVTYGQTQHMKALMSRKEYAEEMMMPNGRKVTIKDPAYVGTLKLLEAVLVSPKLSFGALMVLGHKIGKQIDDIGMWAAQENGVSDHMIEVMAKISKNLQGATDSQDESVAPV